MKRLGNRRGGLGYYLRQKCLAAASILMVVLSGAGVSAWAQDSSASSIQGTVVNSITGQPISRALVASPDNHFATLTDNQGRFEFTISNTIDAQQPLPNSTEPLGAPVAIPANRPYALQARKPGFISDLGGSAQNVSEDPQKDLVLRLIPEAIIQGVVTLSNREAPDSISVELFRRQVDDGVARWVSAGSSQTNSNGEFRFAELRAGTYKLHTLEALDQDPIVSSPGGPLYGYPPSYSQNAPDFASAGTIQVAAGEIAQSNLTIERQRYYQVKIGVAGSPVAGGLGIKVYRAGHKGPGFSLGYNNQTAVITGMLPNGSYTVEALSYGQNPVTGTLTFTVHGANVEGPRMSLVPVVRIPVMVKEDFTGKSASDLTQRWNINGRSFSIRGPRRYLNLSLVSADEYDPSSNATLRDPSGLGDESLILEGIKPGRYWLHANPLRGYLASARVGGVDLLRAPFVVDSSGTVTPIEITMRDDFAAIEGNVDGVTTSMSGDRRALSVRTFIGSRVAFGSFSSHAVSSDSGPQVYCVPLADSEGRFTILPVAPDGSFGTREIPPGAYRLLAFDRPQPSLEYHNAESMRVYDSKGPVVRVAGGQTETIRLQLISTGD